LDVRFSDPVAPLRMSVPVTDTLPHHGIPDSAAVFVADSVSGEATAHSCHLNSRLFVHGLFADASGILLVMFNVALAHHSGRVSAAFRCLQCMRMLWFACLLLLLRFSAASIFFLI
jgi:hypothetical protein